MPEMILPGVYIQEHAEALIVGAPVSTGNIGIVGTASRGPIDTVTILNSFADALQIYGPYDRWVNGQSHELTLVRALEQVYANGTPTVFAVRISGTGADKAQAAKFKVTAGGDIILTARDGPGVGLPSGVAAPDGKGTWGNSISITTEKTNPNLPTDDGNRRVTIEYNGIRELYEVSSGTDLNTKINDPNTGSSLVTASGSPPRCP